MEGRKKYFCETREEIDYVLSVLGKYDNDDDYKIKYSNFYNNFDSQKSIVIFYDPYIKYISPVQHCTICLKESKYWKKKSCLLCINKHDLEDADCSDYEVVDFRLEKFKKILNVR